MRVLSGACWSATNRYFASASGFAGVGLGIPTRAFSLNSRRSSAECAGTPSVGGYRPIPRTSTSRPPADEHNMQTGLAAGFAGRLFTCAPLSKERKCPSVLHSISLDPAYLQTLSRRILQRLRCEYERTRHEVHDRSPRPNRRFHRREYCGSKRRRVRPRCVPCRLRCSARSGWLSKPHGCSPRCRGPSRRSGSSLVTVGTACVRTRSDQKLRLPRTSRTH